MLIKFFKNGQGSGAGPVDYLVEREVVAYDNNRNALRDNDGNVLMFQRNPLPEVLRGNSDRMRYLIDACEHQWSYRAGVLSFTSEDAPTPEQQRDVMDAFEDLAFAGLEPDQRSILWVRHTHEKRVELHFVTPRMELTTGRSRNIAPPGYQKAYDALRDVLNKQHGWNDPQAPERAREVKSLIENVQRGEGREHIHDWILDRIEAGEILDRAGMIQALKIAGFDVPRSGKNYITVHDPASDKRWRLKGDIFRENWTRQDAVERALERTSREPSRSGSRLDAISLEDLRERLQGFTERRATYNRERYQNALKPERENEPERKADTLDRLIIGSDRDPSQLHRKLDISVENDRQSTDSEPLAAGLDDQSDQQRQSPDLGREQASTNRLSFWQRSRAVFKNHRKEINNGIERDEGDQLPDSVGTRIDRLHRTISNSIRNIERSVQSLGSQILEDDLRETGKDRNLTRLVDQLTGFIGLGLNHLREKLGVERDPSTSADREPEGHPRSVRDH